MPQIGFIGLSRERGNKADGKICWGGELYHCVVKAHEDDNDSADVWPCAVSSSAVKDATRYSV